MRIWLLVVMLLGIVGGGTLAQDDAIVLDFYYPTQVGGSVADMMQSFADRFNERFPNVTINPIYTGSYGQNEETIYTELNGGGAGPHVSILGFAQVYQLRELGAILPVEDFIRANEDDFDAFVAQFNPAFIEITEDDGLLWSLPFQRSTAILYYNKDLFAAAGLDPEQPPRNRDELVEYAQALTTEDVWGFGVVTDAWMFHPFASGFGEPVWGGDPTQVSFNSAAAVEAGDFLRALVYDYGVVSPDVIDYGSASQDFISGNVAMILHSTGAMTNHIESAPFEVGVGFIPAGAPADDGTGYATVTGGANVFIFDRGTEAEQQAAWEWVRFLTSAEAQAEWGIETGYIAANDAAWETDLLRDYVAERPQYVTARDQLAFATPQMATYTFDTWSILGNAMASIITGEAEPSAALEQAQQLADSALEAYR